MELDVDPYRLSISALLFFPASSIVGVDAGALVAAVADGDGADADSKLPNMSSVSTLNKC